MWVRGHRLQRVRFEFLFSSIASLLLLWCQKWLKHLIMYLWLRGICVCIYIPDDSYSVCSMLRRHLKQNRSTNSFHVCMHEHVHCKLSTQARCAYGAHKYLSADIKPSNGTASYILWIFVSQDFNADKVCFKSIYMRCTYTYELSWRENKSAKQRNYVGKKKKKNAQDGKKKK